MLLILPQIRMEVLVFLLLLLLLFIKELEGVIIVYLRTVGIFWLGARMSETFGMTKRDRGITRAQELFQIVFLPKSLHLLF